MQQVPTTSTQKFRSHRNFQRILSGLYMPFHKKLGFGFRYRLCPLTRSMHSNAIAADNLTAVKVPPVQFALQSRPLIATLVLHFTGYIIRTCVHWCPPPSNLSCVCVNICHVSRYWTAFITAYIASSSFSLARLDIHVECLCTVITLLALPSINAHSGPRSSVRARLPILSQLSRSGCCVSTTGTSRLVFSSLQQPA
jgi:hypothetical protein